jgi:hypothetical protein
MSNGENISDEVRRYITAAVPSIPFLEAILLFRSGVSEDWTVELLAQRLYIGIPQARELIDQLQGAGIIKARPPRPCFGYAPQTPELATLLDDLEACYRGALLEVTHLIHSKSARQAHRLADAFKFRKD